MLPCMTDKVQSGIALERDLIQKDAKVEYQVLSLGAFLRCGRYGQIDCLAYPWMEFGREGGDALLKIPLGQIKLWYALGVVCYFGILLYILY